LEDQSATIQQIQRVQTDTNNDLAALYMLKVQKTKNGIPYVAGIGAGIEDADGQPLSNILLQADRIAMINPENGNTTPLFVAQGNQLFMNDVFLKRLFAVSITSSGNPPTFSLTPEGRLTARNADISGHISANSGTLKAENIIGDLVKCAGVAFPVDGSYLANGTRTLTVYDDHSFDRQIIIPPIIYVGSKQESRTSNDIWTECFLHVDQNGRRIYSGRSVTEPGIFSGIIDMPAGHGHITLSFTVSSRRQNGSFGSSRISNLQAIVVKKNSAGISIR
ncbi:phage tail tip protein, partial [Escherichia coli]